MQVCKGKRGVKSQISVEFLTFLGISTALLLIFIAANVDEVAKINKERERLVVEDIAYYIQSEIFIAYNAFEGYQRSFEIPEKASGKDYTIDVDDNILIVNTEEFMTILKIPEFDGNLLKGKNKIRKTDGEIFINI